MKKFLTFLCILSLLAAGPALPVLAADNITIIHSEINEETPPETESETAVETKNTEENDSEAVTYRTANMETMSSIKTEDIDPNKMSFTDRITYTTYDPSKDVSKQLQSYITVGDSVFYLAAIDTPTVLNSVTITPRTMNYTTKSFTGNPDNNRPSETMKGDDGYTYRLVSSTLKEEQGSSTRTEYREVTTSYTGVENGADVPRQKEFELTDSSGTTVTATLTEVSRENKGGTWQDNFQFPITITGYDADTFMLNDKEIPKNANLTDYASDFLDLLGMDPSLYRITSIRWNGEQYEKNGDVCRDAMAYGQKYVDNIDVTYGGTVTFPVAVSRQWECVYEEDIPSNERILYTMGLGVTYSQQATPVVETESAVEAAVETVVESVTGTITAAYEASAAAFEDHPVMSSIPVVIAAAVIILLITRKIRHRCVYDRKVKCPYKKRKKSTCQSCVYFRKRNKI